MATAGAPARTRPARARSRTSSGQFGAAAARTVNSAAAYSAPVITGLRPHRSERADANRSPTASAMVAAETAKLAPAAFEPKVGGEHRQQGLNAVEQTEGR